jgi:hypothetical protein
MISHALKVGTLSGPGIAFYGTYGISLSRVSGCKTGPNYEKKRPLIVKEDRTASGLEASLVVFSMSFMSCHAALKINKYIFPCHCMSGHAGE